MNNNEFFWALSLNQVCFVQSALLMPSKINCHAFAKKEKLIRSLIKLDIDGIPGCNYMNKLKTKSVKIIELWNSGERNAMKIAELAGCDYSHAYKTIKANNPGGIKAFKKDRKQS